MNEERIRRILIIKTGTTELSVVEQFGDYDDWFRALLDGHPTVVTICDAWQHESLPDPRAFDGIILTGSPSSVRDEDAWMASLGQWAIQAAEWSTPVLAVCFGHQLAGEILGGRVETNPAGPEYGTIEVTLTTAGQNDPLFMGVPARFYVQSIHRDSLIRPPNAILLASTPNTKWEANSVIDGPHDFNGGGTF